MERRTVREPSATMRANAASLHELYVAMLEAGFSEREALVIIGVALQRSR